MLWVLERTLLMRQIQVHNQKIFSFLSLTKNMLWVLKEPSQRDG